MSELIRLLSHVVLVMFFVRSVERMLGAVLVLLFTTFVVVAVLMKSMLFVLVLVAMLAATVMLVLRGLLVRFLHRGRFTRSWL
jgi:hypothetical protein